MKNDFTSKSLKCFSFQYLYCFSLDHKHKKTESINNLNFTPPCAIDRVQQDQKRTWFSVNSSFSIVSATSLDLPRFLALNVFFNSLLNFFKKMVHKFFKGYGSFKSSF